MNRTSLPALLLFLLGLIALHAQEQVDLADKTARGSGAVAKLSFRIRVVKAVPEQSAVRVAWRHGGEGSAGLP